MYLERLRLDGKIAFVTGGAQGIGYCCAEALAEDLVCFLTGEPILARPVGRIERAVKWVKRNQLVAAMAAAV
mgnify:CR=1 FL=1